MTSRARRHGGVWARGPGDDLSENHDISYHILQYGTISYLQIGYLISLDDTHLFATPVRTVAQSSWSSGSTSASVRPAMRALRPTFERWISA